MLFGHFGQIFCIFDIFRSGDLQNSPEIQNKFLDNNYGSSLVDRPEDLAQHALATRTPYVLQFDETERGKTVYFAAAWQNERGQIGAWSEIEKAFVP